MSKQRKNRLLSYIGQGILFNVRSVSGEMKSGAQIPHSEICTPPAFQLPSVLS